MEVGGEERIAAPREFVWAALNDAEIMRQCIPGCQRLEWISASELAASLKIKFGPLSASFAGTIRLSDMAPPESYTISGEGKGGLAGFAKGSAAVTLIEDGAETLLRYETTADVGGRLARLGSTLIDSSAQRLAAKFFADLNRAVVAKVAQADVTETEAGRPDGTG